MPTIKIPTLGVLTFHRTESKKAKGGTAKDAVIAAHQNAGRAALVSASERQRKPLVELRRHSPYNKFPTVDAVNAALGKLTGHANPRSVVQAVVTSLRAHVRRMGLPDVMLLGEEHGRKLSLTTVLTALHELARMPGPKRLLLEHPDDEMRRLGLTDPNSIAIRGMLNNMVRYGAPHPELVAKLNSADDLTLFTSAAVAHSLGIEVGTFDQLHGRARNVEEREAGQLQQLAAKIGPGVTVILTGSNHLPFIHEKLSLSPTLDVWSAAEVSPVVAGDHVAARSLSYLLAKQDEVLVLPASSGMAQDATRTNLDDVLRIFARAGSADPSGSANRLE